MSTAGTLSAAQAQKLGQAFGLLQRGRPQDALAAAFAVAGEVPRSADAHHLVALCCKAMGNVGEAESRFRMASELAPGNAEILVNYANFVSRLAGRAGEAAAIARRAVRVAPAFMKGWLALGLAALENRNAAEAVQALDRAVALQPKSAAAWQALGRARRAAADLAGAATALARAVELEPANGPALVNLSVVVKLLGRPAEALPLIERARRTGFAGPEVDDAEIGALVDLGRVEEALARARRLAQAAPQYTAAHVTVAHLLWEYGGLYAPGEDPAAGIRAAARAQPANGPLQLACIRFLMEAGRAEEALEQVRALRAANGSPPLAIVEANALDELGQRAEASALYGRIYDEMGVREPAFLNSYSRHLLRTGEPELAAARAGEATTLDPDNQEAWGYLATAWRLLDDPREHWLCDYERLIGLVEVEPPAGYRDAGDFARALEAVLEPLHKAVREPVNQSLRGGSQTPGRLFGRPEPMIDEAQAAITRAVERHVASLPDDPDHPFLRRKRRSVYYVGSWSVKLWSAGRHVNHFHPQGWMSSAYYVSLPPSVHHTAAENHAGWIQFGQPPEDLGLELAPRRYIRPQVGRVALFPSYMWHGTVPFEDDEPRITVAFDMTPID